jgi:hypothetical protein
MNTHYRQGDVLLVRVEETGGLPLEAVPEGMTEPERIVLAYGEVTGHAHALSTQFATAYRHGDDRYIVAKEGATLVHEEHSSIVLEPGVYRVVRQREYSPREVRLVAD